MSSLKTSSSSRVTSESEEKGVEDFNGVHDPGGGTKGAENDDPKENKYRSVYEKVYATLQQSKEKMPSSTKKIMKDAKG